LTAIEHPAGRRLELSYQDGRLTEAVGPGDTRVSYTYDDRNHLLRIDRPGNDHSEYGYDQEGRLTAVTAVTDGRGERIFQATYDDYSRAPTRAYGVDAQAIDRYDLANRKSERTNAKGVRFTRYYDADFHLLTAIDSLDRQTDLTWQILFGPARIIDPRGATHSYAYDALGNLSSETDALGQIRRYYFNEAGQPVYAQDTRGHGAYQEYDERNRLTKSYRYAAVLDGTGEIAYDPSYVTEYR